MAACWTRPAAACRTRWSSSGRPMPAALSLHDALPIFELARLEQLTRRDPAAADREHCGLARVRSEEHTSELQSRPHLVCRLLLEKKKPADRCRALPSTRSHTSRDPPASPDTTAQPTIP